MSLDFHRDPEAMAKCLVSYIACDKRVRSEIRAQFDSDMSLNRIAAFRAAHQRAMRVPQTEPFGLHDGYSPSVAADKLERATILFVNAIYRERKVSSQLAELRAARDRGFASIGEIAA